jgi:hypothetical protein
MARAPRITPSGERVTVRAAYDRLRRAASKTCTQPTEIHEGLRPIPADFREEPTQ